MLLDISGKMVSVHRFIALCVCVFELACFNSHCHFRSAGFSYRRMCRTYEGDSRADSGKSNKKTSGITLLVCFLIWIIDY